MERTVTVDLGFAILLFALPLVDRKPSKRRVRAHTFGLMAFAFVGCLAARQARAQTPAR